MIVRQNSVFVGVFLLPVVRFRAISYAWCAGNVAIGAELWADRLRKHWGETGGTLGDKDREIRVRTGKFTLMRAAWARRDKLRVAY